MYAVVRRIPPGKVTSYGRIARMLGRNRAARAVGYALNALKDRHDDPAYDDIPWQRVVSSKGHISIVNREFSANLQTDLLLSEGIPSPMNCASSISTNICGKGCHSANWKRLLKVEKLDSWLVG